MSAVLITGTDTGIGKSFITYNLALALKKKGLKVGCFKPVETFVEDIPQDGKLLSEATGQDIGEVVPVTFKLPLAPRSAEIEENREVDIELLKKRFNDLKRKYEFVLVEGAGGIAVPIKKNYTYGNFALELNMPVIIVGRAGLGTINHTYLAWFYAKSLGVEVTGIVLNRFSGKDVSERTNPTIVEEMTGIKPVTVKEHRGKLVSPDEEEELLKLVGF